MSSSYPGAMPFMAAQLVNSTVETTRVFWRTKLMLSDEIINSTEDINIVFPEPTVSVLPKTRGPMLISYDNDVWQPITADEISELALNAHLPKQNYYLGYAPDDLLLHHNTMWKD